MVMSLGLLSSTVSHLPVIAQDATFDDKRTTAVSTSTANNGSPANIVITSNGEIEVTSGVAVTVDSNHTVSNAGIIDNQAISNGIGVHFGTQSGETLTSGYSGAGRVVGGEFRADDNYGSNNFNILVDGDGTFNGNISTERNSLLNIYGDNSAGISVQANMVGDITVHSISVTGDNSNGVEILSGLTGNIEVRDNVGVDDIGGHGVYIGADVTGGFRNIGSINAGADITRDSRFNEIPGVASVAALRVSGDLTGGIANDIVFTNSDGDEVNVAEGDSTSGLSSSVASITALSGTNAILITPEKISGSDWSNITIGNTGSFYGDYSLMNQRTISARGVNDGQDVTTILITGAENGGTSYTTTLDFGIYNGLWGTMEAQTNDGNATILRLGSGASAPEFVNNGILNATVFADTDDDGNLIGAGGNAFGVVIDEGATLNRFENNGTFNINAQGTDKNAYALLDKSGTVSEFVNTSRISTLAGTNGSAIAVDLRANTTGITFDNSGIITGDVYLGSGTNTINLSGLNPTEYSEQRQEFIDAGLTEAEYLPRLERKIEGTLFLAGGNATLTMSDNANLTGGIVSPNGQLDVTLNDQSMLTVDTSRGLNVGTLNVNDDSILNVDVSNIDNYVGGVDASGSVSFSDDSRLNVRVLAVVDEDVTVNILSSDNLTIDPDANIQNLGNSSFVYDLTTQVNGNDIDLSVRRRLSSELELSPTLSSIYEASIPAFRDDTGMASHLGGIETREDFNLFYKEIMPLNLSQASTQAIQNANDLSVSAVSAQLDGLRHMIKNVPPSAVRNGIWIQEYAGLYDIKDGVIERGADVFNFGLAAGYGFAVTDRGVVGVSLSYNIADIKFNESGNDRLTTQNTQLGVYSTFWINDLFLEGQASVGYLDFASEKEITLGDLDRMATADWNGLQYSGVIKVGYEANLGPISITPTAGVNYTNMRQDAYTEIDGGAGFNLSVDQMRRTSLTTDLKLEIAHLTEFKTDDVVDSVMRIALSGGWSQQLKDDPIEVSASFEGQDNFFTLQGDPIDKNNFQAGLGVYFTSNYFSFGIRYDAEWRDQYLGHSANMNLRARF